MDNRAIGIFDSGVGGLTVAREVISALPGEEILYLGDTLNVPYGGKTLAQLNGFAENAIKFFESRNVKAVLIACGTLSANCYGLITELAHVPVMEIMTAGAEAAVAVSRGKIGLIATEAAVASGAHKRVMERAGKKVFEKPCPLFVPIVEEGLSDTPIAFEAAKYYLGELIENDIDTLLLGCTHYPLLRAAVEHALKQDIAVVDPSAAIAGRFKKLLEEKSLLRQEEPRHKFFVTGEPARFNKILRMVIGDYTAEKVNVELII